MMPEAPGLFSITTGTARALARRLPSSLAMVSPAPLAAVGTTMRIARDGYGSPCTAAAIAQMANAASVTTVANVIRRRIAGCSARLLLAARQRDQTTKVSESCEA